MCEASLLPREAPVPRRIAGQDMPVPAPITPQMITDAFRVFVAEFAKEFSVEGLVDAVITELADVERRSLPLSEHLRACEGALLRLTDFVPGAFCGAESDHVAELYKDTIRTHSLGMCLFHSLLDDLLGGLDLMPVDTILAPGCGQFYEGVILDAVFAPRTIIGQDTNAYALSLAIEQNFNTMSVLFQNADSARRPSTASHDTDMAVFIHPNILDTDYWEATINAMRYEQEDFAPLETVRAELSINAMSRQWKDIVATIVARLRPGGRLVFVFYETRELELMSTFLGSLAETIAIERQRSAPGLTTWLYLEPPALDDARYQPDTYDWMVMRNYRCGLVARKL